MGPHAAADSEVTFEAVITPHRSLGHRGVRWIAGALMALSLGLSAGLWWLGAWPVMGFSGAEVGLAVWLLRRHARSVGRTEMLLLSESGLQVVRADGRGGRWERVLAPGWLRADLEDRPGRTPALVVRSSGVALEVGEALGEREKRDLAAALGAALERQRSPVFDNPQLRDVSPRPGPST